MKTLRELHLDMEIINSNHLCNLLLSECEKHPNEEDWAPEVIGDRIVGILLQVFICGYIVVGDRCWRNPNVGHIFGRMGKMGIEMGSSRFRNYE